MTSVLCVGLGNPGRRYEKTRHNIGWRVVDLLVDRHELAWQKDSDSQHAMFRNGESKVFLLKPQTFMNDSGIAVSRFTQFYKIAPENIIVVQDEIDLPFGQLKAVMNRGPAGHQGVTSIMEKLGTKAFQRLRIGVGSNREHQLAAEDYVLQNFSPAEEEQLNGREGIIVQAADLVEKLLITKKS